MSDPAEDPPEPEPFDEARAKAKIAKANSEAASLRKRLKDAEEKAARLDEIEDAGKSEVEKLRSELAEAKQSAQEATARADRLEVAVAKALPEDDAKRVVNGSKRIVGASREELEADADDYFASFKPQEGTGGDSPLNGKPREQLRGGGDPTQEPEVTDPAKLAEQVSRGF